jgi:hypothetical protein
VAAEGGLVGSLDGALVFGLVGFLVVGEGLGGNDVGASVGGKVSPPGQTMFGREMSAVERKCFAATAPNISAFALISAEVASTPPMKGPSIFTVVASTKFQMVRA